jgi:sugar lactone lactonase YvrE
VEKGWTQGRIYFNALNTLSHIDPNIIKETFFRGITLPADIALDVANGKMYWADISNRKIQRANLNGTDIEDIINLGANSSQGIALDLVADKIYWCLKIGLTGKIQRANLDGSNVQDVVSGLGQINKIALDVAGGKMYWTDETIGSAKVQRANLDGTGLENFITAGGNPFGIALDLVGGKVYWTTVDDLTIRRANLNGSNMETLLTTSPNPTFSITIDNVANKIYWVIGGGSKKVQRSNLDGTSVEDVVTNAGATPFGLALDKVNNKIYWVDFEKIQKADLAGTNMQTVISRTLTPFVIDLDLEEEKIYTSTFGQGNIQRCNIDGSNPEDLVTGIPNTNYVVELDLLSDTKKMYWTQSNGTVGKIQKANLDGSNVQDVVPNLASPRGIALDVEGNKIYWTDFVTKKIQRANLDGTGVQDLVTANLTSPVSIGLDIPNQKMYWVDFGGNKIQRSNMNGTGVQDLVTGLSFPINLVLDLSDGKMYWIENSNMIRRANLDGSTLEYVFIDTDRINSIALCPAAKVSIQSDKGNSVCVGEQVTFTAIPINGGSTPTYQWKRNGFFVGTNSPTYTPLNLENGEVIEVVMTSKYECAGVGNSNQITMTVNPVITPSVTISVPAGAVCQGKPVTFEAVPVNGGSNPVYQWFKIINGTPTAVGSNSPFYESSALNEGDKIQVRLTSNALCTSTTQALSAIYTVSLTPTLTSSVNLSANISNGEPICNGTVITFFADGTNGGSVPRYIWVVNGVVKDTTFVAEYSTNAFTNNAVNTVSVRLLSSYPCLTNANPVNSANFTFSTRTDVVPQVGLQALSGTEICANEVASFKANPNGGGIEPLFQWYVNDIPQGSLTTNDIYNTVSLQDGDTIRVQMISSLSCASPKNVSSAEIIMQVNLAPTVEVSTNTGNIVCQNTAITFTATPQNAGANPTYQWRRNGSNITGANQATYTLNNVTLGNDQDNIDVIITTSVNCNEPIAVSNPINVLVIGSTVPTVSIKAKQGNLQCEGSEMVFEIDQVNLSDPNATYVWKVNGNAVANSNAPTFNAGILQNGNTVQLQYTTVLGCANPKTANSNTLTINTQALAKPENLTATSIGVGQVNLTWEDKSSNESRFVIERAVGAAQGFQVHNFVLANQTTFIDGVGLLPNTTYYYRVRAVNDNIPSCFSANSGITGATTDSGEIVTAIPQVTESGVSVFPNPSQSGIFKLRWLRAYEGKYEIEALNVLQKSLYKHSGNKSGSDTAMSIDLSGYGAGVYFLKIQYNQKQYFVRLVKN